MLSCKDDSLQAKIPRLVRILCQATDGLDHLIHPIGLYITSFSLSYRVRNVGPHLNRYRPNWSPFGFTRCLTLHQPSFFPTVQLREFLPMGDNSSLPNGLSLEAMSKISSTKTPGGVNASVSTEEVYDSEQKSGYLSWKKPTGTEEITILERPFGTRRPMRAVVIGAGISGLNFCKFSEEKLSNLDVVCYEKNADVGGTVGVTCHKPSNIPMFQADTFQWYENRYDGCACDIPSVNYQFSWRPHIWSKYYSPAREIWQYLKDVEQESGLVDKFIKLGHRVISAEWTDKIGKWRIKVEDLRDGRVFEDVADIMLNGTGVLK